MSALGLGSDLGGCATAGLQARVGREQLHEVGFVVSGR